MTVANSRILKKKGSPEVSASPGTRERPTSTFLISTSSRKARSQLDGSRRQRPQVVKVANFGTGNGSDIDEACWAILNPDGDKLYVSSFGGNFLASLTLLQTGQSARSVTEVKLPMSCVKPVHRREIQRICTSLTMGKYCITSGAYQTFTVSSFDIGRRGTLSLQDEYSVDAATERGAGSYNFLGLAGFDKK